MCVNKIGHYYFKKNIKKEVKEGRKKKGKLLFLS